MKKRNLLILACGALLAGATLTACSSNQSKVGIGIDQAKTVGFMQLANENKERIWFEVDDSGEDGEISKDEEIDTIYVIKSGKMDTYNVRYLGLELKDIKDKNEAEIKKLAVEGDIQFLEEELKSAIEQKKGDVELTQDTLEYWTTPINLEYLKSLEDPWMYYEETGIEAANVDELLTKLAEKLETRKKILSTFENLKYNDFSKLYMDKDVKAIAETDSSGNNISRESIYVYGYNFEVGDKPEVGEYKINLSYPIQGQVYDQLYMGYYDKYDNEFLITSSLDKNVTLGFDTLDTKNVTEE
ncbi:hypothetical protein HO542_05855 [Streptococcus suis]|nr:hypothetical protein [Streptococcus suis]NQN49453.1 hypothetical protein [Streptococcus suis]NQN86959.1 hypothetical protein [Streptococcus suis]